MSRLRSASINVAFVIAAIGAFAGLGVAGYNFLKSPLITDEDRKEIRRRAHETVQKQLEEAKKASSREQSASGSPQVPSNDALNEEAPSPASNDNSQTDYEFCVVALVEVDKYSFDQASRACSDKKSGLDALRDAVLPAERQ